MEAEEKMDSNLYTTDEYVKHNPSLHVEDSPWKISKITPLVDVIFSHIDKKEINLLDIGGGGGVILKEVSEHINGKGVKVNKFALDLSPGMLSIQRKPNPDLKRALNEDIRKTSLGDKQIDIALMIDVLEHIPDPEEALEEIKRISRYAVFKVPLEDNLFLRTWNCVKRGRQKDRSAKDLGHINYYNSNSLRHQIEAHAGRILEFSFSNVFDYLKKSERHKARMKCRGKALNWFSGCVFRISPRLCSRLFTDFAMVLVECE